MFRPIDSFLEKRFANPIKNWFSEVVSSPVLNLFKDNIKINVMWGFIFLVFVKVKLIFNIHEDMLRIFSMRKLLLFFTAIMFSLLNSCVQESALSDVDIDDPSIIKPVISIDKSINTNSIIYTNITWLFDKNNNSIELKSGEVKMNNIDMTLKRGINNEPYYTIEPFDILPFRLDYTYESEISLSDEEVYTKSTENSYLTIRHG